MQRFEKSVKAHRNTTFVPKIKTVKFLLESPEHLDHIMPGFLKALAGRRKLAFYGDMGAGKTTFIKAFCRYLGVEDATASPTFSLINEYYFPGPENQPQIIHHLDLYRLKNIHEALDIGIEDLLDDPHYCLIEWPGLIEPLLPPDVAIVRIDIQDEQKRTLTIDQE
jgi:tRNA threonylcarbamoyladenosine biosynthesis protein TsaE